MKKKFLTIFCTVMLACGAAACGGGAKEDASVDHSGHDHAQEERVETETAVSDYDPKEGASSQALEMLDYLEELPEEIPLEKAEAEGFFTIADGKVTNGQDAWDNFMAAAEKGEEASVVVCQYSMNGGAVLDYILHRADGIYEVVSDTTRDGYERENGIYQRVQEFEALKVFEDFSLQEGGSSYTICVLSNEADLDADTFRTYWKEMSTEAHQTYLLFVI